MSSLIKYSKFCFALCKMTKFRPVKTLLYVFLFFAISSYSQEKVDNRKDFEGKASFHRDRALDTEDIDLEIVHAKQAVHYASLSKNDTLLMVCYHTISHVYKKTHNYKQVKKNSYKGLNLARKLNDKYYLFLYNNLLGIVKASEKKYQLSTKYYNDALVLTKERNDTINESLLYHNIALNYYLIDKFELAKMFMLKSEETYKSIKVFAEPYRKDFDYIFIHIKKSIIVENKDEALIYVNSAIEKAKQSDYNIYLPLVYKYKGRVYMKHGDFDLAITNFKKALTYETNNISSDTYIELINALVKLKRFHIAKRYVETLLETVEYSNVKSVFLDKNTVFSEVYKNTGDFDNALFYANKRAFISDSLLKHNNNELFAVYGKKFETKEKEKEIVEQQMVIEEQDGEKKKMLLFGGVALLIGMLAFQWRFNMQKNKKKEAEDAYEKERDFNQMRTAFLENISHEIRTPLTLVNGYLNLIDEEIECPKIKGYINNALINSKKVIFDADEILHLLKFEDHKLSLKVVSKPLDQFLKTIFLSFEVLANTRNIDLVYKSAIENEMSVEIDARKVEKILTNLISNAIKFSDSNSKIIFEALVNNNALEVKVTDFGQGIDQEDQERIFTRFYQSKNNKSIGGIGIGLLLAKDFALFLDGDVTVESEIGKGSVFTFTMPIIEFKAKNSLVKQEDDEVVEEKISEVKYKPSILVVEDNIEMSNYLKEILSPFYNCTFAFDGFEGLDFAQNKVFDLVASDIMMPKLDGYQFREQLKLIPKYEKIPFILITAKTLAEDKTKGFSIGIDDYITKPFQKEELIVRIDNLLSNSTNLKLCINDYSSDSIDEETHTEKLISEIRKIILENLSNENFKIEDLALQINYSQRQLSRILNKETGLSTVKFILELKLAEAYRMIENQTHKTISEIQYEVGISSPSYFSEKFKNRFGINPSELMQKSTK